jgi:hypothetical protein
MKNDTSQFNSGKLPVPKIKYPFARTEGGSFIWIDKAIKGMEYFCWGCNSVMYRRRSKLGLLHFYHMGDTCFKETAIHEGFKGRLFQIINKGLKQNKELGGKKAKLKLQWHCNKCNIGHKGNLLGPIEDAALELKVDRFKPDISLYRHDKSVYAAIEVEYSHALEDKPRQYYNRNNIGIIIFAPSSLDDIKSLDIFPIIPYSCNLCKHSVNCSSDENEIIPDNPDLEIQDIVINPSEETLQLSNSPEGGNSNRGRFSSIAKFISNLLKRIFALLRLPT